MRVRSGRILLAALTLAGCGGGGGGGGGGGAGGGGGGFPTGAVSGRVRFLRPPRGPFLEAEPNDSVDRSHDLGVLRAGDAFSVLGRASAADDAFDGFRFRCPVRVNVVVTFRFDDAGNDLDVAVHDPVGMQVVETLAAPSSPGTLGVHAKGSFDLVVTAQAGASDWEMAIQVNPLGSQVAEREPNDDPAEAQYLGELVVGDSVVVGGSLASPSDPNDGVVLACPESVRLGVNLPVPAFQDFDLDVLDATADLGSPTLLTTFSAGVSVPEQGSLDVDAGTLLLVRLRAVSGSGPYALTLTGAEVATTALRASRIVPGRDRAPGARAGRYAAPADAFVAGEALVGVVPGRERDAEERIRRRGGRVVESSGAGPGVLGSGPPGRARVAFDVPGWIDPEAAARLTVARVRGLAGSSIAYAEPNHLRFARQEPNDAFYNLQWHYRMLHLAEAWDVTTGDAGVIVAVIDTGRRDHPDLAGRQSGGWDFISSPSMARDGDGRDPDPTDPGDLAFGGSSSFHGTHVAGTIGAATNNGLGVAGVTWNGQIMHLRVLGVGGGTTGDIAEAIRYAAGLANASGTLPPKRADVINMSLGGGGFSQALQDAVTAARNAGVVVVAAAGNSSTSQPEYPASLAGVVSVVALDSAKGRASYSNFGPTCDISAPGGDFGFDRDGDGWVDQVLSTAVDDSGGTPVNGYEFASGTSMACPHVAGVAALVRSVDPTLTPDEVEQILFTTAEDLGSVGRDDSFGYGLVNALAAVQQATGATAGPPSLRVLPTSVVLTDLVSTVDVTISNVGGGTLDVASATATTVTGGDWLAAALLGPADPTRTARAVRLTFDRGGLPPGLYTGSVVVESDGGSETIDVVADAGLVVAPLPNVDVHVLALRLDTNEVVQEAIVNPTVRLDWSLQSLPAGEYVFLASTDLDHDGTYGEDGDWWGAFPLESDPEVVVVLANTERPNVDFSVAANRTPGGAAGR